MKPVNLKTNHHVNPLGIDSQEPVFSWQLGEDAGRFQQSAFELCVQNGSVVVWESGAIDTHIHLYEPVGLDWLKPDSVRLNQPHHAERFKAVSAETPVSRAVVVEAGTSLEHNEWMLQHADVKPAVAAVIGNLDLADPETEGILERFSMNSKFRGLRNRARGAVDFSDETVRKNLQWLESRKMVLEPGLDPHIRKEIVSVAKRYPDLTIIINHMADGRLDADQQPQSWWDPLVRELGECSNVYCKLSMFDAVFQHDYRPERLNALFVPIVDALRPRPPAIRQQLAGLPRLRKHV